ncbi:MAG: MFS transporter, partial [Streptomycetaceae bacterium]|nr:MFS transporter [Streptomycetaceae bacterium]
MTTRQAPPVQQPTRRPGTTRGAFTLLCAGMVMSNLDLTVANIGLPAMQHDLAGSTLGQLSWVLDGYAIVFAALLVPAGRWADRVGLRRAFLIGAALFAGASAACALAPDVWLLVGGRLLQAAGAAVMLPASLALLLATSPADRRPSVVRMWAAVSTTAAALGPVLGGLLVTASWRWLFLVNLPVGVVTVALGGRLLPAHRPERKTSVPDVAGSLMAALGIGALALTLVKGADWGWSSWRTLAAAACGALLLTVTAWRIARHPRPLIEPALLRIRTFTASGAAALLYGATFGAFLLSFTLWCQSQLGWSAIRTGLALTPGTACTPFVTLASAALARRYRPTAVITVGSLALAAGVLWWTLA